MKGHVMAAGYGAFCLFASWLNLRKGRAHSHWSDGSSACPYGPKCDAPDPRYTVRGSKR